MINGNIITNKGISIGRNSETLLNVLLAVVYKLISAKSSIPLI